MRSMLLLAAATLALGGTAQAHRQWLLPSGTVFADTQQFVTVDAAVSNDLFFFDHQPGRLEAIRVWQPDGSTGQTLNGATLRYRSVFDVKLDKPGTWKIGTQMTSVMGSYKVNGEERRVGGRGGPPPGAGGANAGPGGPGPMGGPAGAGGPPPGAPRPPVATVADIPADATDVKLTEVSSRNEIYVTAGQPTKTVLAPTGKGLEADWVTHPDELVSGEAARIRFLIDGKPAAGLKLAVIPGGKRYRDAENGTEVTTGADGTAAVTFPAAGMYWLNATATDRNPAEKRATERRMNFIATVEVLTP